MHSRPWAPFALAACLALGAHAQPSKSSDTSAPGGGHHRSGAGVDDGGLRWSELPVEAVDGGFAVALPQADAGTAQLVPPSLREDSPAVYPEALRARALTREVPLELQIDAAGEVESARVLQQAEPEFVDAALAAAKRLRFEPATLGGVPVPVVLGFTYRFEAPPPPPTPKGLLRGLVRNRANRRPLVGASVLIEPGELRGETDASGRFAIPVEPGPVTVTVTSPGYLPGRFAEQVGARESVELLYGLVPTVVNPYETIVEDTRERTEVARITLRGPELREVPGTMGDPFRVVMLLPGVGSIASGLAYPVVRGTQPAETGYFIDGVPVPILFHLFLGPSVVNSEIVDSMDFYAGAAPAPYGGLLGGIVDAHLKRAHEHTVRGNLSVDLINTSLLIEYPFESTGTTVSLSGRFSYTGWLLQALTTAAVGPDAEVKPVLDFWDYQARIDQRIGDGTLRLLAFGSSDTLGVVPNGGNQALGTTLLTHVRFHRLDLRWQQPWGQGQGEVGVSLGQDQISFDAAFSGTAALFSLSDRRVRLRSRYGLELSREWKLEVGGDLERQASGIDVTLDVPQGPPGEPGSTNLHLEFQEPIGYATLSGLWAQALWKHQGWAVTGGLRGGDFRLTPGIDNWVLEPRLAVRKALTEAVTLKAGGGLYHQAPTALLNVPSEDVAGLRYGLQSAIQTDLGVEWKAPLGIEVTADVYYTALLRTLEYNPLENPGLAASGGAQPSSGGPLPPNGLAGPDAPDPAATQAAADAFFLSRVSHGRAYGFELLLRRPLGGNWFGWISYTLQRSERYASSFPRTDGNGHQTGTASGNLAFAFDQTHVLNAVVSHQFPGGWTAGVTFHLNSGAPESGGFLFGSAQTLGTNEAGDPVWVQVDKDRVPRLPLFWRVDVRVAKELVFDGFTMEAYLDVLNATFNQEVLAHVPAYDAQGNTALTQQAIAVPIALVTLGLKASF